MESWTTTVVGSLAAVVLLACGSGQARSVEGGATPQAKAAPEEVSEVTFTIVPSANKGRVGVQLTASKNLLDQLSLPADADSRRSCADESDCRVSYEVACHRGPGCHFRWTELFPALRSDAAQVRWRFPGDASVQPVTTYADPVLLKPTEMSREWVWVGPADRLEFSAFAGEDLVFVGAGVPIDSRWLGSDVAILRTVVGDYFGARDMAPFRFLVVAVPSDPYQPTFRFHAGKRGLAIEVQLGATWSAHARIDLAQVLVTRWLGSSSHPDTGVRHFWNASLSRYVALHAMRTADLLTQDDFARAWSTTARAAHPDAGYSDAVRESAKGTLLLQRYAERLGDGRDPLREVISESLRSGDTHLLTRLEQKLGRELKPQASGVLPSLGPCYRGRRVRAERFSLGFSYDENGVVAHVDKGGAAQRVGITVGDKLEGLQYVPGDTETHAKVLKEGREILFRPSRGSFDTWIWEVRPRCKD